MRFMMFIKMDGSDENFQPTEADVAAMAPLQRGADQGRRAARARRLAAAVQGRRVTFSPTASATVTDGPFAEAKEVIGGYWIIQTKSQARRPWSGRRACPGRRATSTIELRQIFEMSDFSEELQEPRRRPSAAESRRRLARPCRRADAADDRRGLADRVAAADRRARAHGARRRRRRGPRAGCARRGAGAVAAVRRPRQPGRLAHGHGQTARDRPASAARETLERKQEELAPRAGAGAAMASRRPRRRPLDDDVGDDLFG